MSRFSKLEAFLGWIEHVRLVFDVVVAIGSLKVVKKLLSYIPQISHDWASIIAWFAAAVILVVLMRWHPKSTPASQSTSQSKQETAVIPALSTLFAGVPAPVFEPNSFFRSAYYSPITSEVEKNMGHLADQSKNPQTFLLRFSGVFIVQAVHEYTWLTIFKSQLVMLLDMNGRGGYITLAIAKSYYDKAAVDYPGIYLKYSFEQWLSYMKEQRLILQHPSEMLEITIKGKDFLKYCTHWGHNADARRG